MSKETNPLLLTDFYKISHYQQYPKGTEIVYSNLTARKSMIKGIDKVVFFGLHYFIKKYLIGYFDEHFFKKDKEVIINDYSRRIKTSLGADLPNYKHIEDLHDLGYLPLEIKALPEGSLVNLRVPMLTIKNTKPEFFWLTNFIESFMSCVLWKPVTSATIAYEYRKLLDKYAEETGIPKEFVQWQGHDFSFRGMSCLESAELSGMGHLLSFTGTDTIPAIDAVEKYYYTNAETTLIGGSVPATEHSVMCTGSKEGEIDTFRRLITETYPKGIVSIVSDTWDLWKVCTEYLKELKDLIMSRDGKVVIRPDSGDPVNILCGEPIPHYMDLDDAKTCMLEYAEFDDARKQVYIKVCCVEGKVLKLTLSVIREYTKQYDTWFICESTFEVGEVERSHQQKGVVELLWEVFGGTTNEKGYKVLDPHIGVIYGDSITLERAESICKRLQEKGFASQVVFGIGSYTYQYNTRDTFGMAIKATYAVVNGESRNLQKSPVTDDGTKHSATGLLKVVKEGAEYRLIDKVPTEEEERGCLKTVFKDGLIFNTSTFEEIRKRLNE